MQAPATWGKHLACQFSFTHFFFHINSQWQLLPTTPSILLQPGFVLNMLSSPSVYGEGRACHSSLRVRGIKSKRFLPEILTPDVSHPSCLTLPVRIWRTKCQCDVTDTPDTQSVWLQTYTGANPTSFFLIYSQDSSSVCSLCVSSMK